MDCPAKLYYQAKPEVYQNNKTEDAFLKALAKAGYQVGELAKCYYRDQNPHDLTGMSTVEALKVTRELLEQDKVVIFEAAVVHQNLFVRADILIKNHDSLKIIEIKSSTWNKNKDSFFMKKEGIYQDWLAYIYDVVFQKHVLEKAYPKFRVSTYLGLLDKTASCPTQGLNLKFRIARDENDRVIISGSDKITNEELSKRLIIEVNTDDEIRYLHEQKYSANLSLAEYIELIAEKYIKDEKMTPTLGNVCAKCEFRIPKQNLEKDKKSGFDECWRELAGFKNSDFDRLSILDLWNSKKRDQLIKKGIYFLADVDEKDIVSKKTERDKAGFTPSERQLFQVEKAKENNMSQYIDKEGLAVVINSWKYPLHFIDFETAAPSIPLAKNAHPYEGFAFQFSHHVLRENGTVEHVDEFLNTEIGVNPNLSFIRALKESLTKDTGTIFRYHNHENTYLNYILKKLISYGDDIKDKNELILFIKSIAKPSGSSDITWETGERCMIDLCKLVELYTFDPSINGKTSIKKVLPAILNQSEFLQRKYGRKIYGKNAEIKSLNFEEPQAWVIKKDNKIADPYSLLPKIFENIDVSTDGIELLFDEEELREGGAASIAYMYMQFSEMSDTERSRLRNALLKYCELDTLAMVMIVESWLDSQKNS